MLKRRTLFFLPLSGAAGCRRAATRLNVFNWSNYIGPDTLERFYRETGIEVRYAIYESNEELTARILGGNSGWDVIFPSNYFVGALRDLGLLRRLDRTRLRCAAELDAQFQHPHWDRELQWAVPYMWGSSGILCNPRLAAAPSSYADLWDARYAGRMTMLDDPPEVFGAALKMHGLPLNDASPEHLRLAQREALRQKPLLRAYLNAEVRDQAVAGDVAVCQLWATTSQQAIDAAPHLRFVYPKEGFALYADCAAILRESRREELAYKFINFVLRPDIAASIVATSRTATSSEAARRLLPLQLRELQTLFPPAETLKRGEWFEPLPAASQRLRDRLWTELKSA